MCGIFKNKISTEKKYESRKKSVKYEIDFSRESTHQKQDIHVMKSLKTENKKRFANAMLPRTQQSVIAIVASNKVRKGK